MSTDNLGSTGPEINRLSPADANPQSLDETGSPTIRYRSGVTVEFLGPRHVEFLGQRYRFENLFRLRQLVQRKRPDIREQWRRSHGHAWEYHLFLSDVAGAVGSLRTRINGSDTWKPSDNDRERLAYWLAVSRNRERLPVLLTRMPGSWFVGKLLRALPPPGNVLSLAELAALLKVENERRRTKPRLPPEKPRRPILHLKGGQS